MKKIVLSLTAAAALSGFAMAGGDIVPAPAPLYDWSGFYVGATFGEAWNADVTLRDVDGYNGGGGTGDFSYDADGIMGGLYAGYNWQNGNFVFGLEGEGGFIDLDDSAQYPPYVGVRQPDDSRASIDTDWYVSLTGRIGYAFDNTLLYLKGGVTGVHTEVSFIDTDPTGLTLVSGTSATDTLWGPTIGGGVEYALSRNFTIRAEYMYVNIDDSISHTALGSNGSTYTFKHEIGDMHTAKIGFTYRF